MKTKSTFADRVSAFFSALKNKCRELFSKQTWKDVLKDAFNKRFFKAFLVVLFIAVAVVGLWIAFAYSLRLGWWLLSLTIFSVIAFVFFRCADSRPLLHTFMADICLLAAFCICFYVGKAIAYFTNYPANLPEHIALLGFASLIVTALVLILFYGIYCSTLDRSSKKPHDESFFAFLVWLVKWVLVLGAVFAACYIVLQKVLPLV